MTQKFRNTATGRVVVVKEPAEVIAEAEAAAEDRAKAGSKRAKRDAEAIAEAGVHAARAAERTLKAMNDPDGRRWKRVADNTRASGGKEPAGDPDAGDNKTSK